MDNLQAFETAIADHLQDLSSHDPAHKLDHIVRVVRTAKYIAAEEHALAEVVLPAAYLHDCVSFKKNHPDRHKSSTLAADKALQILSQINYPKQYFPRIHNAIQSHSYSANVTPATLEAQVVQDADRLDALGAIGIARCVQVGVTLENSLYSPKDPFCRQRPADDQQFTIDHFYSKLLHLANSMHTRTGKKIASQRTGFMKNFLSQLEQEIEQ